MAIDCPNCAVLAGMGAALNDEAQPPRPQPCFGGCKLLKGHKQSEEEKDWHKKRLNSTLAQGRFTERALRSIVYAGRLKAYSKRGAAHKDAQDSGSASRSASKERFTHTPVFSEALEARFQAALHYARQCGPEAAAARHAAAAAAGAVVKKPAKGKGRKRSKPAAEPSPAGKRRVTGREDSPAAEQQQREQKQQRQEQQQAQQQIEQEQQPHQQQEQQQAQLQQQASEAAAASGQPQGPAQLATPAPPVRRPAKRTRWSWWIE
jgi:hypothetical protein